MIFEKKKIRIETLSEYLAEARRDLNLSLEQVAQKTSIKPEFLNALESGQFKILPADVYVFGFLSRLAEIYSANSRELIAQYQKEKGIQRQIGKIDSPIGLPWYKKYFGRIVVTPKLVTLFLGLAFVALTVVYIVWQVFSINKTPNLKIFSPANNSVIQGSSLRISGQTDSGMTVSINGEKIFVDNQGNFQTPVSLTPGPKTITVTAENHFGKSTSQTLNVTGAETAATNTVFSLKVDFTGPVTLNVAADGQPGQTLNFGKGGSETFTASQEILLSTSDAGATIITLNGQSLGAMGKSGEKLTNIAFSPQYNPPSVGHK